MNQYSRRIYLKHAYNVRDLGGYQTPEGKMVKWNVLYRGDGLSGLDAADWQLLKDKKVRTVLDLRSLSETKTQRDQVAEGIEYVHCPLQKEDIDIRNPLSSAENAFGKSLTQGYLGMVREYTPLLAAALGQVVAGLAKGAVLFHCTAGKDRTGVLAATVLYLLGIEDEDIIADYQVSYTYNRQGVNKMLKDYPGVEKMKPFLYSAAETMEALLEYFEEIKIRELLARNGFSQQKMDLLREFVLE